jgi:hypothetical protein
MKKTTPMILLIFFAGMASAHAAQSRETLTLAADGLKTLRIDCGAGYLKVQGVDGLAQIEVTAVVAVGGIADNELDAFKKEYVKLTLKKVDDRAELLAAVDSEFNLEKLFGDSPDARIDLDVRLPRRLALAIDDGSGDTDIRDMDGPVKLDDGSGSIVMENILGAVDIEDGSGDIRLVKIGGPLEIEDGSGEIDLIDAGGSVEIEDGSGRISLRRVGGSVQIDDGSGDIVIDGVEKDVIIDQAGSGSLDIRHVKGRVRR